MTAVNGEQVLIEKEFALAGAKLIQQFQRVLHFIKSELEPVFCPSELDEFSNDSTSDKRRDSGIFQSLFSNLATNFLLDKTYQQIESNKNRLMRNTELVNEFKQMLKTFERYVRVFEMTYLDLKDKMQTVMREKNLQCAP